MALIGTQRADKVFETMVQMILNQSLLGMLDRFLHRLQLLCDIQAGAPMRQHVNGAAQVPAGSAKALDDGWMGGMCVCLCHGGSYPLGEVTIAPSPRFTSVPSMTLRLVHPSRPDRAVLSMRWLVLIVILFGAILSSIGGTNSHGLAAMGASLHTAPVSSNASHEHAHVHEDDGEDSALAMVIPGAEVDHPHHGADHSHDKAHALPAAWQSSTPQLPGWFGLVRPWMKMVRASRLERPPMG